MELSNIGVFMVVIALLVVVTLFVIPKIWQLLEWQIAHDKPVDIKIVLHEGGLMPVKAHDDDACYDLYLPKRTDLQLGRQSIPLNFSLQIPDGYCAYIRSRSGNMSKGMENIQGDRFDAEVKTGIVDAGYRGVVGCIVQCNVLAHQGLNNELSTTLPAGYRIAQMAILPVPKVRLLEVRKLDDSERGEGGFGSTGTK